MKTLIEEISNLQSVDLAFSGAYFFLDSKFEVHTNTSSIIAYLDEYFREWTSPQSNPNKVIQVNAIHSDEELNFPFEFEHYKESPEKRLKEAYYDEGGYRLIKKVKTGVHFITGPSTYFAIGPVKDFTNQLINFMNAIFMEIELQNDAYLFHAAGIANEHHGIALAAPSGKGKSTTALNLMNHGYDFVSNDRVIIQKNNKRNQMIGVPKHPRVNPGTLLNNSKLTHLVKDPERFDGMSVQDLWEFEEKYDAIIPDIYGEEKFPLSAQLKALVIIDWEEEGEELSLDLTDLNDRKDLLPAIMKKPSLMTPVIHAKKKDLSNDDYIQFLSGIDVYVLCGKRNTEVGTQLIGELLNS